MPYKLISADGHVESHPSLWNHRVAAKYRDRAPQLGKDRQGRDAWIIGKHSLPISIGPTTCGLPYDQMVSKNAGSYTYPDGTYRPGLGDGLQRVRVLAMDGIDAEVLFPPVYGPDFLRHILEDGDKDAYLAVIHGYNSWLALEYCAVAPDRLIGTCLVPETGIDDAIAEMERCAKMGFRAVCPNNFPNGTEDAKPEDDRFWAASLDLNLKMAPHQNFGRGQSNPGEAPIKAFDMGSRSRIIGRPTKTIGQLIATKVFDRFPKLQFYFAEAECGWLPFHLESSDDWFLRYYHERDIRLPKLPSQYWRDHMRFCFASYDPAAIQQRYLIGLDMIMWGSDLPHSTGSWPNSREVLDVLFREVPADERKQILVENVCKYFSLDPEKELAPVP